MEVDRMMKQNSYSQTLVIVFVRHMGKEGRKKYITSRGRLRGLGRCKQRPRIICKQHPAQPRDPIKSSTGEQ